MSGTNGNRIKIAVLATDLKYVRSSVDLLEKSISRGFSELKTDLKATRDLEQQNSKEIAFAKASIKTLRTVFLCVGGILSLAVTVYAALR